MAAKDFYDTTETIKSIGAWTWKDSLLWRKIQPGCGDQCWTYTGSRGPHANLFGARKNNKPQMTQVPRLIWMSIHNEDVELLQIRHTCGNRYCCNPQHMYTEPNQFSYKQNLTNKSTTKPKLKLKQVKAKPLTRQWWQQ